MKLNSATTVVSIVVPLFNEENNIEPLYNRIEKLFVGRGDQFELIFVNDGSADRSAEIIERLRQRDEKVKTICLSRNFGHQVALSAGLDYADGDAVILIDADLQHPPEVIPELLKKWREGYDNVYTIRKPPKNLPFLKKYFSQFFYRTFRKLTKLDIPMNSADFRLLDRKIVLELRKIKERNRFLRGLIYWTGFKSIGIEYDEDHRYSGEVKYNIKTMLLFAINAIVSFTNVPLYLGILVGVMFSFFGLIFLGYAVYIHFFTGTSVPGWASIVCLLSILGGIQLIVMGLIGVYIGKIFEEVKQRPLYLVKYSKGFNEKDIRAT